MENKYSECERLQKFKDKSQLCGEFLAWLQTKYRLIGKRESFETKDLPRVAMTYSSYINIPELLAEFFDIDLVKVEEEKNQMLKKLSKAM